MMFNRLALIAAAKETIRNEEAALVAEAEKKNAERESEAAEWLSIYGEAWLAVLLRLRKKLRNGQPLYTDDFPQKREWRAIAVFGDRPYAPYRAKSYNSPDLNNLIAVLSTIEDETVTPSGLRAIGVTSGALSAALRTLGRAKNEGN
jgi:hypothetical protein